jgi:putative Mg2+ transporter-C (MgtC) family protein
MFIESTVVTAMGLTALTVLRRFEDKNDKQWTRRISITLDSGASSGSVLDALKDLGVTFRRSNTSGARRRRLLW